MSPPAEFEGRERLGEVSRARGSVRAYARRAEMSNSSTVLRVRSQPRVFRRDSFVTLRLELAQLGRWMVADVLSFREREGFG